MKSTPVGGRRPITLQPVFPGIAGGKPLKVAFDARMIKYTGIGRYIQNLIVGLARHKGGNRYSVIVNNDGYAPAGGDNIEYRKTSREIPPYSLREQILLPYEVIRTDSDMVHYPSFNMPFLSPKPAVVTIHDLIYLDPASCPNRAAHLYAWCMLRRAAASARKIITISQYSKKEIVSRLGVRPDKVVVIYHGVSPLYRVETDNERLEAIRNKYSIQGPYLLYVGNHQPRKNIRRLFDAFSMMRHYEDYTLVLTGKIDPRRQSLYSEAERDGLKGRVLFVGEVPEIDLPALYSGAALFVFPSLSEGFGLPPLEAMACGVPIVSSAAMSIPEVVGDAGILIDASDTGALCEAMDRVLSSSMLRDDLVAKGLKRAARFSWDEATKKTLRVYEELG